MSKIAFCLTVPIFLLFLGLAPEYIWAIPLAMGLAVVLGILLYNTYMDDNV